MKGKKEKFVRRHPMLYIIFMTALTAIFIGSLAYINMQTTQEETPTISPPTLPKEIKQYDLTCIQTDNESQYYFTFSVNCDYFDCETMKINNHYKECIEQ